MTRFACRDAPWRVRHPPHILLCNDFAANTDARHILLCNYFAANTDAPRRVPTRRAVCVGKFRRSKAPSHGQNAAHPHGGFVFPLMNYILLADSFILEYKDLQSCNSCRHAPANAHLPSCRITNPPERHEGKTRIITSFWQTIKKNLHFPLSYKE